MSWQLTCPKCGSAMEAGDRFCTQCGQPVVSAAPTATNAPAAVPPPLPTSATPPPLPASVVSKRQARWMIAAVVGLLICVCGVALIFVFSRKLGHPSAAAMASRTPTSQTGAGGRGPAASAYPSIPPPPPLGATVRRPPTPSGPTPAPRGVQLFIHSFETPRPITTPLFGSTVMSVRNVNGECEFTGSTNGVLPAMFGRFLLDDFIIDCEMRAGNAPAGSAYGLVFRAADVQQGRINSYYALLLDPNANAVVLGCWEHGGWTYNQRRSLPPALSLRMGMPQVTLEAIGSRFRVFVDKQFAAEFNDGTLRAGRIGLCVLDQATVYFDNFRIDMTSTK